MTKPAIVIGEAGVPQDHPAPKPDEIRRQLRAILSSPAFQGSKRCQQFLEFVCERSLAGGAGSLKERTIAIEVFGRQPESDLGEDTIVRVSAREVRKRLAQYYITPNGAACEVRIELPSGCYAPDFRYPAALVEVEGPHPVLPVVKPPVLSKRRFLLAGALTLAASVAVLAVVKLGGPSPSARAFQQFWEPVWRAPEPLLVAVAHPIVYHPSSRASKMSEESLPPAETQVQQPIQVPPDKLNGSDFVPVLNQYVGFGDLVAATEVASMLARKSKAVRVRMASNIEFADLRQSQILLIGAITNRWTMELQQSWRFRFSRPPGTKAVILDTQSPSGSEPQKWAIPSKDDGSALEDYLMICRMRSSYTGGLVMAVAGLKQFGTEAAGRLLADPEQLGLILSKLKGEWAGRNLQLILHARVIGNTPAQPEVVATHVW